MKSKKQQLLVPHRKELFEEFLTECDVENFEKGISQFSEADSYVYNLILRRMKLAENLRDEEVFTTVNKGVGLFEEGALRLHLLLGCIEVIARLMGKSNFIDYNSWLSANKSAYVEERASVSIDDTATQEQVAHAYHQEYLKLHGVKNHFYRFFHECLTDEDKKALLNACWVMKKRPLPHLYDLQSVGTEIDNTNESLNEAALERTKWNNLDKETKVTWIAEALYSIRNLYTHSLVPYTSVQDKTSAYPPFPDAVGTVNRGDTVFIFEKGIAISFAKRPTSEWLRCLVRAGLKHHFKTTYVDGN